MISAFRGPVHPPTGAWRRSRGAILAAAGLCLLGSCKAGLKLEPESVIAEAGTYQLVSVSGQAEPVGIPTTTAGCRQFIENGVFQLLQFPEHYYGITLNLQPECATQPLVASPSETGTWVGDGGTTVTVNRTSDTTLHAAVGAYASGQITVTVQFDWESPPTSVTLVFQK